MENSNIDKTFNEASKSIEEPATFPGFDKVWAKVEEKLDKKETEKRNTIGLWIPYGIAASLLIGSGIFYFTGKKESTAVPKQAIAQQTVSKKDQPAEMPVSLRETDSTVRMNIQKQMQMRPKSRIAYREIPKLQVPQTDAERFEMPLMKAFPPETGAIEEGKILIEAGKHHNVEEIIATGLKKEKASMVQELSLVSSKKKIADLTAVADTAEAIYPDRSPVLGNDNQEPEILAYNKNSLVRSNLTASASGDGNKLTGSSSGYVNRIGKKEAVNSIRGKTSGVNINSISGSPGSGKVEISISCQGSVKSDNNPLFIINGKEADPEAFRKIDPEKIQAIRIFKDEKATLLFGRKAAKGAVLVETKNISRKEKRSMKKLFRKGFQK